MNLTEVENLSFAALKSQRQEILAGLELSDELKARYLQARTDAAMRDEKLAEQGQTIKALQDGMGAATERASRLAEGLKLSEARGKQLEEWLATVKAQAARDAELLRGEIEASRLAFGNELAEMQNRINDVRARAERLKAQAIRNQAAVNGAAKLLNDAIAAQQIDVADKGA